LKRQAKVNGGEAMECWFMAGSQPGDYEPGIDANTTYKGKNNGYIKLVFV
jgi:hypothetical protein